MPDPYGAEGVYFVDPATRGAYAGRPVFAVDPATGQAVVHEQRALTTQTGAFYGTFTGTHATASAVAAVDTLYLYPFVLPMNLSVVSLNARVVTGGAGSSMKMGVWANSGNRPSGAPLLADNTGVATATSTANVAFAGTVSLTAGTVYWVGSKFTGTLPALVSVATTSQTFSMMLSRAALIANAITGVSIAATFATAMPTFTGAETWTESTAVGIPLIWLGT